MSTRKPSHAIAMAAIAVFLNATMAAGPLSAQGLPALTDEVLRQTGAALHMANGFHADYPLSLLENGATGWYDLPGSGVPVDGLSPLEADQKRSRSAWRFIRDYPGKFLEQAFRKVRIFWAAYPHPAHRFSWDIVGVLSAVGVIMTRRAWRQLMPVYLLILQTAMIPILFTSMPRFRAPIEPFLIVFGAVPPVVLWHRWRREAEFSS